MSGLIAGIVIAGLIGVWFVRSYRQLLRLKAQVANAWAQVDVQLTDRHHLVVGLIEIAKESMHNPPETLAVMMDALSRSSKTQDIRLRRQSEGDLTSTLNSFFRAVNGVSSPHRERVNELKVQLDSANTKIDIVHQFYNDQVLIYNVKIDTAPLKWAARLARFKPTEPFEIEAG